MTSLITSHHRLPTELWHLVIEHSPRDAQRKWLFVSKFYHDITFPIIFKKLSFYYASSGGISEELSICDLASQCHVQQSNRNETLLRHIVRTPAFARVVREIFVCWYERNYTTTLYERQLDIIAEAISVLHNLRVFSWGGETCKGRSDIFLALSQHCKMLQHIRIPSAFITPEVTRLQRLTSFVNYFSIWIEEDESPRQPRPNPDVIHNVIDANASSLHTLTILGDALWTKPLPSLRHLTLNDTTHFNALPPLLALDQLTTLRLYALDDGIPSLLSILSSAATACPHLVDIKLILDSKNLLAADAMEPVAAFLKNKRRVRRLHVVFYAQALVRDDALLEILKDLPALEVLGIELARERMTKADLQMYDERLPMGLTDLLLYTEFEEAEVTLEEIAAMIQKRTRLRTINIPDLLGTNTMDIASHLMPTLPNRSPGILPALELISYKESVYPICRGDPSYCKTPQAWEVDVEAAGWEDWYWLLEYDHVLDNPGAHVPRDKMYPGDLEVVIGDCNICGTGKSEQRKFMFPYRPMLST